MPTPTQYRHARIQLEMALKLVELAFNELSEDSNFNELGQYLKKGIIETLLALRQKERGE